MCKHCEIKCLFIHVFSDLSFAGFLLFFQIKLITKYDFILSGGFGNVIEEDEIQIKEEMVKQMGPKVSRRTVLNFQLTNKP